MEFPSPTRRMSNISMNAEIGSPSRIPPHQHSGMGPTQNFSTLRKKVINNSFKLELNQVQNQLKNPQ